MATADRSSRAAVVQLTTPAGGPEFNTYQRCNDISAFIRSNCQVSKIALAIANDAFMLEDKQGPKAVPV